VNSGDPVLVYLGAPRSGSEYSPLSVACRFYGIRIAGVPSVQIGTAILSKKEGEPPILAVVANALELDASHVERLQSIVVAAGELGIPVALIGITEQCSPSLLSLFNGPAPIRAVQASAGSRLFVTATSPSEPGFELRGIPLALGPGRANFLEGCDA